MKKFCALFFLILSTFVDTVKGQSTYNDVASIFYTHCTYCHHQGGVAPFSLINYEETSSYSNSIYAAVNSGSMPPWQPDTTYSASGKTVPHYLNENILTEVERNQVLDWIMEGVAEGNPSKAIVAPKYGEVKYRLNGNPDLTLKIPTFRSNASPALLNPYNCFVVPTNLTEDRWLRAFEISPGNLQAVHHVVVSIDTANTKTTDTTGVCGTQGGQIGVGVWTPGAAPMVLPSKSPLKTGIRIPAGSTFIIQVHYVPGSDGMIDSTKIRLFFYPRGETGIRQMYSHTLLQNWGLGSLQGDQFPVGFKGSHKATSGTSQIVPHPRQPTTDFCVFSVNPHSHFICTKIKNYAFKGTDTIPIIRIPNWDSNWEGNYFFPTPLKIPTGYTLEAEHYYDNSVSNVNLTGPPVSTSWGQGTDEEMLFDSFLYFDYQPGDEEIDLKSMIENDTLFIVGIDKPVEFAMSPLIYPNPVSGYIHLDLPKISEYKACIYNIMGESVLQTAFFVNKTIINLQLIPPGIYLIEIIDSKANERISKKIMITAH